jgi:hypothetical protein
MSACPPAFPVRRQHGDPKDPASMSIESSHNGTHDQISLL